MRVLEAMTGEADVVTAFREATLKDVARLLVAHRVSGVPVVDAERRVLGVVSEADIVRSEAGEGGEEGLLARAFAMQHADATRTAGEAMTSPAVTIRPDQTVVQAARLIEERGVNRLPVVDDGGRLLGIFTRADLVRAFARSDEEIAREVRASVVEGILGLRPGAVDVQVEEGEVQLSGDVDTGTTARLVEYFASRVPGVVAVRSSLRATGDGADAASRPAARGPAQG